MGKRKLESSQSIVAKRRKNGVNHDKEVLPNAGIIQRVELRNFMNHAHLSFDFQPRVNIVTGFNGTGKSAILTGLVVGLGGKASSTSRGSQISGFIKDGKNVSDIKVVLNNGGPDAYQPDVYGDSIVVERKLSRSSNSGDYKIKTASMRLMSTKKSDLTRILDHFNIQVENPVAILNQETSKNFLYSKNPGEVYQFFTKATKLEQMKIGYDVARKEFKASMDVLKSKESVLPMMELELKQAQEKAAALESIDKIRSKLDKKECELAWAIVEYKENEHHLMNQRLIKLNNTRPKYEATVTKSQKKVEKAKEHKVEIEEKIQNMAGDTGTFESQRSEFKKTLMEKRQVTRTNGEAMKQVQQELAQQQKDKTSMQERIAELRASSQKDHSSLVKDRDEKLSKLTSKLHDLETKLANAKKEMNESTQALTTLREEKMEHASIVGDLERIKKDKQQKIGYLEKSRGNKFIRFGKYVPAFLEEINRLHKMGKFTKKPVGPIGAHICIKDMRYALGAERAISKSLMTSFYVNHKSDAALLNDVKRRICKMHGERPPEVLVGAFTEERYHVEPDKAQTHHPTLMDQLMVDNNIVFNCLVDQISMHNIVMVLNGEEARALMFRRQPKNSHVCYDEKGDEILPKPDRVFANHMSRPNFLSANVEEDIREETQGLREVSKDLLEASKNVEKLTLQIQSNHEKHSRLKGAVNSIERQIRKINTDMEEINAQVIEQDTIGDVDALISDVNNLDVEIEQLKVNLDTAKLKYNNSKAAEQEVEKQLSAVTSKLRSMNSSIDPLRGELNTADEAIDQANNELTHYKRELKKLDEKISKEEESLNRFMVNEVEKSIQAASQMSPRVKVKKTSQSLQAEIAKLKEQLSREEQLRGNADEIRDVLNSRMEKYETAKSQLQQCQLYRERMTKSLSTRRRNLFKLTLNTADTTKLYFATFLHQRNYEGKLQFDFDKQTLAIKVDHQSSSKSSKDCNKDLKGLSGGEKSFSTLCFIMSLWESINSPFRCMDEFDVFMDMVNRKVSIKMLTEFAKENPSHQFILLTPQDTSQIEVNDYVHIFRMPDPKRGN